MWVAVAQEVVDWSTVAAAVSGIGSLVIAVAAAIYARSAARQANEGLRLTREQHAMSQAEHTEFVRQLSACAEFQLTATTVNAEPDGVLRTDATGIYVRVAVGIENVGERAAGQTTLNVLVPAGLRSFAWCGANGEDLKDAPGPAGSSETLLFEGEHREVQYVDQTIERVGRRSHPVRWVRFLVELPSDRPRMEIPVRVYADADELPGDQPQAQLDHTVVVERQQ